MKKKTIVLSIVLSLVTGFVAIADGSQTPLLEERFEQQGHVVWEAGVEWCKIERNLAESKLSDYSKKKVDYSTSKIDELNRKANQLCGNEESTPIVVPQKKRVAVDMENYDLNCLADAVAVAETNYCQAGSGLSRNNCFGIMAWTSEGKRYLKSYPTNEGSFDDFKRIWSKHYDTYPTMSLAIKWTGNDNAQTWLSNVNNAYSRCYARKFDL